MDEEQRQQIISKLKEFYKKLKRYQNRQLRRAKIGFSEAQDRSLNALRLELQREHGRLSEIISKYGGITYGIETDLLAGLRTRHEVFSYSLSSLEMYSDHFKALDESISLVNKAIGKLESDIKLGIRDEQEKVIEKPHISATEPPKAFIVHGGISGVLNKLRDFIEALGIKPIIVELSASKGMSVDDKVNKYIKDADCGIVLATKGGIVDTTGKKPKQHPRLNVIDELERLRATFPEKTILLVERGVDLPSNVSGLTYEPFVGQSMDRAFTAIARELVAFGILKAVKPQE